MIIKKSIKGIFNFLLFFCVSISSCYSTSVLKSNGCEKSENLITLYKVGKNLENKLSEYLEKVNSVTDTMKKYKIGKSSVVFNDTIFKYFDELKYLDKNLIHIKNYIKRCKFYSEQNLKLIKDRIFKLISKDEYIRKLSLTILLIEIKYGHLDKCSREYIEDLMIKRIKYILLTETTICDEYSRILKCSLAKKNGIDEKNFDNNKDFLDYLQLIEKQFNVENDSTVINALKSEIENFFNSKRLIYAEDPKLVYSNDTMNEFLNRILNVEYNHIPEIAFLHSLMYDNEIKSNLKYVNKLLNGYISELINKSIFFIPSQENWENYYAKEFRKVECKVRGVMDRDTKAINKIVEEIKNNPSDGKMALPKVYLDTNLFKPIYTNSPNVFFYNQCSKSNDKSTICTCKCINNLLEKFSIKINDSNIHLKEHFKNERDIISRVLDSNSNLSYSGKFNVSNSVFSEANNIKDMFNTPIKNTIVIISTSSSEKELKKFTNYTLYIYDYEKHGFLKTGNVYSKLDKNWHPAYAMVIVKDDENNNLVTAHPRNIS